MMFSTFRHRSVPLPACRPVSVTGSRLAFGGPSLSAQHSQRRVICRESANDSSNSKKNEKPFHESGAAGSESTSNSQKDNTSPKASGKAEPSTRTGTQSEGEDDWGKPAEKAAFLGELWPCPQQSITLQGCARAEARTH
jgi:hypothetical protein